MYGYICNSCMDYWLYRGEANPGEPKPGWFANGESRKNNRHGGNHHLWSSFGMLYSVSDCQFYIFFKPTKVLITFDHLL